MENTTIEAVKETVENATEVVQDVLPETGSNLKDIAIVAGTILATGAAVYGGYRLVKWIGAKVNEPKVEVVEVVDEQPKKEEPKPEAAKEEKKEPEKKN